MDWFLTGLTEKYRKRKRREKMGYVILHSDPQAQTRLAITTDFKTLIFLDFSKKTAKEMNIRNLVKFVERKGKKVNCNKYKELKPPKQKTKPESGAKNTKTKAIRNKNDQDKNNQTSFSNFESR